MLPLIGARMVPNTEAAAGGSIVTSRYNGTFSKSGLSSTLTSPLLTATIDGTSSGAISFLNFEIAGSVSLLIDDDGGGFVSIAEGHSITQANGDTLQIRVIGINAGESVRFDIVDVDTGDVIEAVTFENVGSTS